MALSYIWHSPFSRYMPDIFLAYFGGLLLAGGGRLHADWLEGQLELGGWMTSPPGRGGRARARGGVGTLAPPTDAQESAAPGDIRNEKKGTTKMNTKEGSTPRNHSPITHTPSASCNPPLTTAISPCNYPPRHPLITLNINPSATPSATPLSTLLSTPLSTPLSIPLCTPICTPLSTPLSTPSAPSRHPLIPARRRRRRRIDGAPSNTATCPRRR